MSAGAYSPACNATVCAATGRAHTNPRTAQSTGHPTYLSRCMAALVLDVRRVVQNPVRDSRPPGGSVGAFTEGAGRYRCKVLAARCSALSLQVAIAARCPALSLQVLRASVQGAARFGAGCRSLSVQ